MSKFIAPSFNTTAFNCSHCGVLAPQTWSYTTRCMYIQHFDDGQQADAYFDLFETQIARCSYCKNFSLWVDSTMVYPTTGGVELANPDMPEDVLKDYNEAKNIVNASPRGATALLRLAVQKLCIHLGEKGENINRDIASLVEKGLPKKVQQALDSVRVVGNNAVHPGEINFDDDAEVAHALFSFINVICVMLITEPKKIDGYFEKYVPQGAKDGIKKRDGPK